MFKNIISAIGTFFLLLGIGAMDSTGKGLLIAVLMVFVGLISLFFTEIMFAEEEKEKEGLK
jgi:hypothetical protein